jgi:hypothetical protein
MIHTNDCVLVLYTFKKRHKYLPFIDRIVSKNLNFIHKVLVTNEKVKFSSDLFYNSEDAFTKNLEIELKNIRAKYSPQNVLLLLEDLLPLKNLSESELNPHVELMNSSDIKYLSFRTYEFGDLKYDYKIKNHNYFVFTENFKFYCQLQPTIWNLDYLIDVLEDLNSKNLTDPWSFEFYRTNETHLMSEMKWPNILGGFFEYGFVNKKALIPVFKSDFNFGLFLTVDFILSRPKYFLYRIKRFIKK